jgi:hypothetical protein
MLSPSFILHHGFSRPFFCLVPVPVFTLPLVNEGGPVRAKRVQFYRTPGTTHGKHIEEEIEQ